MASALVASAPETAVDLWTALHREATLIVQKRNNGNDHEAFKLIRDGKIDPAAILSHRFPLDQGAKAFETMAAYADGVIKPWIAL